MSSSSSDAGPPEEAQQDTETPSEVAPGGQTDEEPKPDVDPEAPGAALVDPDLEPAEPNEPG